MKKQFAERLRRTVSVRILLVAIACIALPVAVWAQWTTSSNNIYNSNSGNIGIGTTSPSLKLDIVGPTRISDTEADLWLTSTGGGAGTWRILGSTSSTTKLFRIYDQDNSVDRFNISATGNVGIGTPYPAAKLQVNSTGNSNVQFSLVRDTSNLQSILLDANSTVGAYIAGGTDGAGNSNGNANDGAGRIILQGTSTTGLQFQTSAGVSNGSARSWNTRMAIDNSGNVTMGSDLTVSGNISAKYQDLAEWVPAAKRIAPGTVVIQDSNGINTVIASTEAYDTRVAGVVSATPGIVLGEAGQGKVKVATTGRVKVRVDANRAPVRAGDLLVTSDKEGVAMRSEPLDLAGVKIHRPGTLIGKALEPLAEGEGEILVLLSLQ